MLRFKNCTQQVTNKKVEIIFISILISTVCGLNCNSNPCMYGICIDDAINSSYSCYCIDGYTGVNCEINWDDCWSNPCFNGGTCNDGIATYNCTCTDSFMGFNCEQKFSECYNHPCLNNGTCHENNGVMCQCPEGYSGEYCEIDESVCNNTLCKNGGECIEGPGLSFTCDCQEGWTGEFCEEDVNECLESPCHNGGLCINLPSTYTCACLFGFTGKDCDKAIAPCETNPCENDAVCLYEDMQFVCYCVPDYHGTFCESRYDDCEANSVMCENGGTCIDGINNFTCACLPQFSGQFCTEYVGIGTVATTEEFTQYRETSFQTTTTFYSIQDTSPTSPLTTAETEPLVTKPPETTTWQSSTFPANETRTDFVNITPVTTDHGESVTETTQRDYSTESIVSTQEQSSVTVTTIQITIPVEETSYITDLGTFASISDIGSTSPIPRETTLIDVNTIGDFTTATPPRTFSPETTTENATIGWTSQETLPTMKTFKPIFETTTDSITTYSTQEATSTGLATTLQTEPSTEFMTATKSGLTISIPGSEETPTTDGITRIFLSTESREDERTTTDISTTDRTVIYKCDKAECANTSLCLQNFTECDCSYPDNCRNINTFNAAFNGKSYVRHDILMADDGKLSIFIRLRTKSKDGILVHTLFDEDRYALLYLEAGQLKFQFSCGSQTMLFGEIDSPINNGFEVDVEISFRYIIEPKADKCSAKLLVNDTIAMSGEQVLPSHENVPFHARLHLGGIPATSPQYFLQTALGFVGCMSLFKVNNLHRHFMNDATETFEIDECISFACLLNPCQNFGACEEFKGQIRCTCVAGHWGEFCEKSACDNNPCYFGSTCITSPGTMFICACPLGMHGLFCEEEYKILQPSFSILSPGFYSYVAYGLSVPVKDSMELKIRFIPHIMEQISLIAFMGHSGSTRRVSDYFSITFVKGYIMYTWDLGSGVRRIFTNKPINIGARKSHTLTVGRKGRDAWLHVEGVGNVTGRSIGTKVKLNVSPILYVGGHKSKYLNVLPHDLPLHTGFIGCIYDIELHVEGNIFPITKQSPATGRGVGECYRSECSNNSCKNGAVCINHGPTYSCICMKGWEGPDCSTKTCDFSDSTCHKMT